jgi:hypothetical protein
MMYILLTEKTMTETTINNIPLQDHLKALMDEVSAKLREVAESQKDTDRRFKETDKKFQELAESQKETAEQIKETDRQMRETAEQIKETDRQMKETDKIIRRNNKQMGDLHQRFGQLAEHLVVPGIKKRFNSLGFNFSEVFKNAQLDDASGNRAAEVDVLLESRDTVMVVEIKSRPNEEDVTNHINRMGVLRRRADDRNDTRTYFGAIAGAIMPQNVRDCIVKNGFYAVEQSGDTMMINVPDNFKPRHW